MIVERNRSTIIFDSSEEHLTPFYPPLPVELIRDVIERVALSDKPSAASLVLVSKNFYTWVTPLMYRTVTLETRERILSFIHCMETSQCDSVDNTRHIFSLAIHKGAMQYCDWTLSLCGNIRSLFLWSGKWDHLSQDAEGVLWSHPWHVVIIDVPTMWLIQRVSLFSHTSHLYLDETLNPQILQLCLQMPTLTHICFELYGDHDHDSPEVVVRGTKLLLDKPLMKLVLVKAFISGIPIMDFYGGIWASLAEISDERLFVMPGLFPDQVCELFESGETVWDTVEEWKDWRQEVQSEDLVPS